MGFAFFPPLLHNVFNQKPISFFLNYSVTQNKQTNKTLPNYHMYLIMTKKKRSLAISALPSDSCGEAYCFPLIQPLSGFVPRQKRLHSPDVIVPPQQAQSDRLRHLIRTDWPPNQCPDLTARSKGTGSDSKLNSTALV